MASDETLPPQELVVIQENVIDTFTEHLYNLLGNLGTDEPNSPVYAQALIELTRQSAVSGYPNEISPLAHVITDVSMMINQGYTSVDRDNTADRAHILVLTKQIANLSSLLKTPGIDEDKAKLAKAALEQDLYLQRYLRKLRALRFKDTDPV